VGAVGDRADRRRRARQLLADPRWHYKHPYFDALGARLAYFSDENSPGVFHIWVWDLVSGERKQVTFGDAQGHCIRCSAPTGRGSSTTPIAGTDEDALPAVVNLQELNLTTGVTRVLTTGEHQYKHPFYIDDNVITFHFEDNMDGSRRLCAMHLKNGEIVQLTDGEDNDKHPYPFADRKASCTSPGHQRSWAKRSKASQTTTTSSSPSCWHR